MKLTNREKKLLILLFIVVASYIYYQFIYYPQTENITKKNEELALLTEKANVVKEKVVSFKELETKYKVINSKDVQVSKRFFPFIIQEKIITILDTMIHQTNLDVSNISFSKIQIGEIKKEKETKEETSTLLKEVVNAYLGEKKSTNESTKEKQNENKEKLQVEQMRTTINFEGTYEQLTDFIKTIEAFDKKILIENLTLASTDEFGEQVAGNMVLNFYAIPKFQIDEEYFKWDYNREYGKENPFVPFDGYEYPTNDLSQNNNESKASSNNKIVKKRYDFYIGVHPITADIPSVIIGKANDPQAKTYVYADNPTIENVEFQLLQKENKYYYKYKTQQESYPQNYEESMIEFNPKGKEVILFIISSERKDDNDNSGMNLSIMNESDLQLKVNVEYDDSNRPRVMIKKEGNVMIN